MRFMGLSYRMQQAAEAGTTVAVAILGAGYVGRSLTDRLHAAPGMRPALIVNRTPERAVQCFVDAGYARDDVLVSDDCAVLTRAIKGGTPAVTTNPQLVKDLPIALVVAATGAIEYGALAIIDLLEHGIDVVSLNAEVDALLGPLLHRIAADHDAIYTIGDGDQPGAMLRQVEFVDGMGLDIVAAVNCKRHMDIFQNPEDSRPFAERDNTSVLMTTAFGDGTKMQIENAVVANVTGLKPDRRGMHGVETTIEKAATDIPNALESDNCIEFTLGGDFGAGVGVLGRSRGSRVMESALKLYKMGDGPNYFFFRPFHLVALEIPRTIAQVVLDRRPLGRHPAQRITEVVAVAKRELHRGDQLDGIGGFGCYGEVARVEEAAGLLPIGLSEFAAVTKSVAVNEPVALDHVEVSANAPVVALWERQKQECAA